MTKPRAPRGSQPHGPKPDQALTKARPGQGKRREVTCKECGGRTTATGGVCRACKRAPGLDVHKRGLKGGRWVGRAGVSRWVPDETEVA